MRQIPHMRIDLKSALCSLPLPATATWPQGVWDQTVFSHATMSVLVFTPLGRDYQTTPLDKTLPQTPLL